MALPALGYVGLGLSGDDPRHEVAGGSYTRIACDFVALADGSGATANLETLQWPVATTRWGQIYFVQVWDSLTGGTMLSAAELAAPVMVDLYAIAHIRAGSLVLTSVYEPRGFGRWGFGILGYGSGFPETLTLAATLLLAFDEASGIACEVGTWGPGIQCQGGVIGTPYSIGAYGVGPYSAQPWSTWLGGGIACETGTWAAGPVLAGNPPVNVELVG